MCCLSIDTILDHDPTNASRFKFLEDLDGWASTIVDQVKQAEVKNFVMHAREQLLTRIRAPTQEEIGLLVSAAGSVSRIAKMYASSSS